MAEFSFMAVISTAAVVSVTADGSAPSVVALWADMFLVISSTEHPRADLRLKEQCGKCLRLQENGVQSI